MLPSGTQPSMSFIGTGDTDINAFDVPHEGRVAVIGLIGSAPDGDVGDPGVPFESAAAPPHATRSEVASVATHTPTENL